MKVSELITRLQKFHDAHGDMIVLGRGFDEGGYDAVSMDDEPMFVEVCSCDAHREDINAVRHHGAYDSSGQEGVGIKACFVDANCT